MYYNCESICEVKIDFRERVNDALAKQNIYDEQEDLYQSLWKAYFDSVNIKSKKKFETAYSAYAKALLEIFNGKAAEKIITFCKGYCFLK